MPRLLTDRRADVCGRLCAGSTRQDAAAALGTRIGSVAPTSTMIRFRLGASALPDPCVLAADHIAAAAEREHRRAETP